MIRTKYKHQFRYVSKYVGLVGFMSALLVFITNCAAQPTPVPIFVGPTWAWSISQFNNGSTQNVTDPNQYTIVFSADGTLQVKADCNTGSGTYKLDGNEMTIKGLRTTLVACPEGSLSAVFIAQLQSVGSYLMSGSELILNIQDNTGRMIFAIQAAAPSPTPIKQTVTPEAVIATATALPSPAPQTVTPVPVTAVPQPPTATPVKTAPPVCPGPPVIEFFRAEPATIQQGQTLVLRWGKVSNATQVVIDQGVGGVGTPGSIIVAPQATTNYVMTATGCGGNTQVTAHVAVFAPTAVPPTAVPPTAVPPTAVPPTKVPPTEVPPTEAPPPTAEPGAGLTGVTWRWTGLAVPAGMKDTPTNPSEYTVLFNADGTLGFRADCNSGSGGYTLNGNNISIQLGVMTQVQCPEGSLSNEFLTLLPQATTYSVQGNSLSLFLNANSGTMTFVK